MTSSEMFRVRKPSDRTIGSASRVSSDTASIAQSFVALSQRGVQLLLVYSADDIGFTYLRHHMSKTLEGLNVSVSTIEGGGHTFGDAFGRDKLLDVLTGHLQQHWSDAQASSGCGSSIPHETLSRDATSSSRIAI